MIHMYHTDVHQCESHECVQLFIQRSHSYTVRCSAHALSLRIVFGLHFLFPFFSRVQVVCKFKKNKIKYNS